MHATRSYAWHTLAGVVLAALVMSSNYLVARVLDAQLAPVAGFGQGDMAHVELEVEVIIVDPVGMIEIQRH